MTLVNLSAATAAKQILGFYDTIPAMDPKAFAAGLVEILSNYPPAVLERAVSPSRGIAAFIAYPNLAKMRERLEEWSAEYYADLKRREPKPKALPEPPRDIEMEAKIQRGLRELSARLRSGMGPSTA